MAIGFHSHNNLQLSYSNAMALLQYQFPDTRNVLLDSSVMGMGKGAGNLNTELLLEHLNIYHMKQYRIEPLMELIERVINVIHNDQYWGYAVEYYLSSINHCSPSYGRYFRSKNKLSMSQVSELLGMIQGSKKISFDKNYAEKLYLQYNLRQSFDDNSTINNLKNIFNNKKALVIAPGKSIIKAADEISRLIEADNVVSVSLNNFYFETDYVLVSRLNAFEQANSRGLRVITTSNVNVEETDSINVIDYRKWIEVNGDTHDSAGVVILKLLSSIGVKDIMLAGFDGFTSDMNRNYFDITMRRSITNEKAQSENKYYSNLISSLEGKTNITFITKSIYSAL
jgi:4-hydroxy 2-oxovalerate aldolase